MKEIHAMVPVSQYDVLLGIHRKMMEREPKKQIAFADCVRYVLDEGVGALALKEARKGNGT